MSQDTQAKDDKPPITLSYLVQEFAATANAKGYTNAQIDRWLNQILDGYARYSSKRR